MHASTSPLFVHDFFLDDSDMYRLLPKKDNLLGRVLKRSDSKQRKFHGRRFLWGGGVWPATKTVREKLIWYKTKYSYKAEEEKPMGNGLGCGARFVRSP